MKASKKLKADFFNVIKLFYLLLILLILLSTATYTWFSLSRAPKINDMALYISTASGLEISHDMFAPDEQWGQTLIYSEHYEENTVLRPVTYSDQDGIFYAATVGVDGRIIAINQPLDDNRNANRNDINGYYVKFEIYARTNESVTVSLKRGEASGEQGTYVVGMPEWSSEEIVHHNGGKNLQNAMRIGFRITRYDAQGAELDEEPLFIVYEPNCSTHHDDTEIYYPTPGINGEEHLVPESRLIRQEASWWEEADPVQKDVVVYNHGEFADDPHLFDLDMGCKAKIAVYLWLEGQDVDCNFDMDEVARVLASIQFYAESGQQSGMDDIR